MLVDVKDSKSYDVPRQLGFSINSCGQLQIDFWYLITEAWTEPFYFDKVTIHIDSLNHTISRIEVKLEDGDEANDILRRINCVITKMKWDVGSAYCKKMYNLAYNILRNNSKYIGEKLAEVSK